MACMSVTHGQTSIIIIPKIIYQIYLFCEGGHSNTKIN